MIFFFVLSIKSFLHAQLLLEPNHIPLLAEDADLKLMEEKKITNDFTQLYLIAGTMNKSKFLKLIAIIYN